MYENMAKYDTYTLSVQLGKDENRANLTLSVLFENDDDVSEVIKDLTEKMRVEGVRMKDTGFLQDTEQ